VSGIAALALVALAILGCGREQERAAADKPYVVQVDVGPQIHALGDETIAADEAVEQLTALGPAAIPALDAALRREPDDVRQKAVEALSAIGTAAAVPALLAAAEGDASLDIRGDALRALGSIGDERATAALETALADQRLPIRAGGVVGCATLCTSPSAIERLGDIAISDPDMSVALAAGSALAAIREKGPTQEQLVRAAIERRRPAALPGDASPNTRALSALLVSDLQDDKGVPALLAGLDATPFLQRQIAWRLGTVGDASCVPRLRALFESPDPVVRTYAYDALVKLESRGVQEAAPAVAAYAGPKPRAPLGAPDV